MVALLFGRRAVLLFFVGAAAQQRRRLTSDYVRPVASELLEPWTIPVNNKCRASPCSSQVHVTLGGPNEALVTFASATDATPPIVEFGYNMQHLNRAAHGMSVSYSQLLNFEEMLVRPSVGLPGASEADLLAIMNTSAWAKGSASYENPKHVKYGLQSYKNPQAYYGSPVFHHVVLRPLRPGTTVHYRVANDDRVHTFRMPRASSSSSYAESSSPPARPFTLGLCADIGQTAASNMSMARLLAARPDVVLLAGDLSYADGYYSRWDSFGNLFESLSSQVPVLTCPGNHEVGSGEQFLSYNSRWRMPAAASGSSDNTYYAIEIGPVYLVALNSYAPTHAGSLQHAWLLRALSRLDRTRTPWLVVMMHAPFYCSNSGHVEETRLMRRDMERVLYEAGADFVLNGHVHAYERTFPTFDMAVDECGPIYLTIGDGGNREGVYLPWLSEQPEWSAYRESSFGVGTLQLLNASHARYEWHRHACQGSNDPSNINFNQTCESITEYGGENGDMLGVDEQLIEKPKGCANRWRSGATPAPAAPVPEQPMPGGGSSGASADLPQAPLWTPAGPSDQASGESPDEGAPELAANGTASSAAEEPRGACIGPLRVRCESAMSALIALAVLSLLLNLGLGAMLWQQRRRRRKVIRKLGPPSDSVHYADDAAPATHATLQMSAL